MKQRIFILLAVVLLVATTAVAQGLSGRCAIRFFGESTLHGFEGQVACQPFTLPMEDQPSAAQGSRTLTVKVLVAEMDTDNSGRDKKMHAMFQSEAYPQIEGLFADIDPQQIIARLENAAGPPEVLPFELKIHEITQPVQASIRNVSVTAENISFSLEFPVSLASYQLEAPSVLGLIRVADQVRVEARVVLQRQ